MMENNITNENYFEVEGYLSASVVKRYLECEVRGKEGFGDEMTDAMLVGSYVDAYIEGTLDKFVAEHPEIISSRGPTKGELKSEFKKAEEICRYIDDNERLQQFMVGEKQRIMTFELEGVPFKMKMDIYAPGITINDFKVMRTVTSKNGRFYDFISEWGYDIQLALYQEGVFQNTGDRLPCYICAVTKEDPINSVIVNIPQEVLDRALYRVRESAQRIYDLERGLIEPVGCGICKSCISARKTDTPIVSMYELMSEEII